jgi:protease-4
MHEVLATRFWAMEETFLERMVEIISAKMDAGKDLSMFFDSIKTTEEEKPNFHISSMELGRDQSGLMVYELPTGSRVARIPLVGALTKTGGMCARGSEEIAAMIHAANQSSSIDAIVAFVDGPGGSVSGTKRLGNAFKDSQKPIVSYIDETAASAHVWAISHSDYIMGNREEYTQIGSIGVMAVMTHQGEKLEKEGTKVLMLRGNKSVDKNLLNSVEAWTEAAIETQQNILNQMNEDFINHVKEGRGSRLVGEEGLSGAMYSLDDAISLGLADYSGSFGEAIELAADLARTRKRKSVTI